MTTYLRNDEPATIEWVIQKTRSGIDRSWVDEVAGMAGLTDKEMARVLNVSIRSLHAKRPTEPLSSDAAERLLLLHQIVQHGLAIFDANKTQLTEWLRTPLAELALRPLPVESHDWSVSTRQMGRFDTPYDLTERIANDRVRTAQTPRPVAQTPLDVMDTVSGFRLVENVLGRIETGVFS